MPTEKEMTDLEKLNTSILYSQGADGDGRGDIGNALETLGEYVNMLIDKVNKLQSELEELRK